MIQPAFALVDLVDTNVVPASTLVVLVHVHFNTKLHRQLTIREVPLRDVDGDPVLLIQIPAVETQMGRCAKTLASPSDIVRPSTRFLLIHTHAEPAQREFHAIDPDPDHIRTVPGIGVPAVDFVEVELDLHFVSVPVDVCVCPFWSLVQVSLGVPSKEPTEVPSTVLDFSVLPVIGSSVLEVLVGNLLLWNTRARTICWSDRGLW